MTIAAKHLDPVVGVDTHIILIPTPGGPVPTPLPHPFVGMVMDPMDYIPGFCTTFINGLPRALAGTQVMATPPHIPMGGPFQKPPANEGEIFMGSSTVAIDGDAQSFMGMQVLTCSDIGMPAPPRKKGAPPKSLVMPTSTVLSIPAGGLVMIGGPPTVSVMALGGRAAGNALGKGLKKVGKLRKASRRIKALSDKLHKKADDILKKRGVGDVGRNRVHRSLCKVTGHPVDVATGKVFTEKTDFELPGPIPFKLERVWYSTSAYKGPFGHGWHHSYDLGLTIEDDVVLVRMADGRYVPFPTLKEGAEHFDRKEKLTLLRDSGGYALRDAQQRLHRFVDAGRPDGWAMLSSIRDPVGNAIQFQYDTQGHLSGITDSAGRQLGVQTDHYGRIVGIDAPHPDEPGRRVSVVQYVYDAFGNLAESRDAHNRAMRYQYRGHLLVRETDRNGLSFYFEYDADDESARCIRTWGDDGIYDHTLHYDTDLGITTTTNSLGYKTQDEHRGGLVIRTVDALGAQTLVEYNDFCEKVSETDALGQKTVYAYDERGNTTTVVQPDGATIQVEYDARNNPVKATDALGGTWQWRYDDCGRLIERKDPLERVTKFTYEGRNPSAILDPAGQATGLRHDAQGNLVALYPPDGTVSEWEYDGWGRPIKATDPNGNVQQRVYDRLSRVVRVHEPDGNIRELRYDAEGNVVRAKDAQHDVRFVYQGMGRLAMREEAGTRVRFEYDTEEQLKGILNEHGYAYRFELGPTGEVEVESGFDGVRRRYQRDLLGRVTEVHRASGLVSKYSYDPAGRVTAVEHSDGSKEHYAYRKDGELVEASNDATAVEFKRDALGRITREVQGPHWVQSEYDARGLRTRITSSLGADIAIDRNMMGDVMQVGESGGFQASFQRDRLGLELERQLPGGLKSRWKRDKLGRPVHHEVAAGNQLHRAVGYKWGVNDRLHQINDGMLGPVQYGHDALGNLAWAQYTDGTKELRAPDAVGNLFKTEDKSDRKYGPAGQLLEARGPKGVTAYSYDAEGNLIEKREPTGAIWMYEWAADGMLSKVTRPDGSEVTFQYDPLGRRIAKTFRGQTTHWMWDGNVPLHEWVEGKLQPLPEAETPPLWQADPEVKRREALLQEHLLRGPPDRGSAEQPITWLFEPESFAPMARLQGGEQQSILTDHLGTPVGMYDAAGKVTWSARITTYGNLRDQHGERRACPFRFPGQYEDPETGLYYNRFRYYDPEGQTYVSSDPIRLIGGFNHYRYSVDPAVRADPWGLSDGFIFRGVHAEHPALEKAKSGVVEPADPDSLVSAKSHNKGNVSGASKYTSWTHDPDVAISHATKHGQGALCSSFRLAHHLRAHRGGGSFQTMSLWKRKCF